MQLQPIQPQLTHCVLRTMMTVKEAHLEKQNDLIGEHGPSGPDQAILSLQTLLMFHIVAIPLAGFSFFSRVYTFPELLSAL